MELEDLIMLAAAAMFRVEDGVSTSGGRTPGPDPYAIAVNRAKKLWAEVLKQKHEE